MIFESVLDVVLTAGAAMAGAARIGDASAAVVAAAVLTKSRRDIAGKRGVGMAIYLD
jgi:hypothetical protein